MSETTSSPQVVANRAGASVFGPTDSSFVQLLRYTCVGGIAFVADFAMLFALTSLLSVHYLASAALAFALGVVVNYWLSVSWVFSRRSMSSRFAEFVVFAGIGIVSLGLNELIMWFFTAALGLFYLFSKLISGVLVFLFNFVIRKALLFR